LILKALRATPESGLQRQALDFSGDAAGGPATFNKVIHRFRGRNGIVSNQALSPAS
jgi:hypothetical protein